MESGPAARSIANEGVPSIEQVRQRCQEIFGVRPCKWQIDFARAILERKSDVVLEVGTGMGKTLAFWLPILFRPEGTQIVVTALNALGQQCVRQLKEHGISAVSVDGTVSAGEMAQIFKVR